MDFIRARTDEQIESRQQEILDACVGLYSEGGFSKVTIKAIAERTSFSRPSVYNYYHTKEEILLDLLKREYLMLGTDFSSMLDPVAPVGSRLFCHLLTKAYIRHEMVLRIITQNLNAIENNSREERLCLFKTDMKKTMNIIEDRLSSNFPATSSQERMRFLFNQSAFAEGLYSITHFSPKQERAMEEAQFPRMEDSFEVLCEEGLYRLMSGFTN